MAELGGGYQGGKGFLYNTKQNYLIRNKANPLRMMEPCFLTLLEEGRLKTTLKSEVRTLITSKYSSLN